MKKLLFCIGLVAAMVSCSDEKNPVYDYPVRPGETVVPSVKAEAVKATVEGKVSEICPASVLRHKPGAILYLDNDSSKLLESSL